MRLQDIEAPSDLLTHFKDRMLTINSTTRGNRGQVPDYVQEQLRTLNNRINIRYEPDSQHLFISAAWVQSLPEPEKKAVSALRNNVQYLTSRAKALYAGTGIKPQPNGPKHAYVCWVFDMRLTNALRLTRKDLRWGGWAYKERAEEMLQEKLMALMQIDDVQAYIETQKVALNPSEIKGIYLLCERILKDAKHFYEKGEQLLDEGRKPIRRRTKRVISKDEKVFTSGVDYLLSKEMRAHYVIDVDRYVTERDPETGISMPVHKQYVFEPNSDPEGWLGKAEIREKYTHVYIRLFTLDERWFEAMGFGAEEMPDLRYKYDLRYRGGSTIKIGNKRCRVAKFEVPRKEA